MKLTVRSKRVQAFAVLLICLAFAHACQTFLLICLAFGSRLSFASVDMSCVCSRLLFDAQRQTERLAECSVPIPPWVGIAIRAFSDVAWLSNLAGSLRAWAFSYGDPDRERRDARTRRTESAARRECVFCVNILALLCFPRGVRWGYAPQTCAKESSTLWTLFIWVAAWVRFTRGGGTRV